ncbi:MAG: hypothetical protein K1Y02_22805 [Candidatus Hydrogenedentes bacterium]|nr:hypothetical protein [Candidatus Hydrogenedentota bacterium]
MARKSASKRSGVGSVIKALTALPLKGLSSSQPLVTAAFRLPLMSVEALVALAKVYRVSQREVLGLVTDQLSSLRNNKDAMKLIEELAGQVSLKNASLRTQALTKGSLMFLNDLSERLGIPRDAIIAGFLSLIGADVEAITHRQRKKLQEALRVIEALRAQAESAEADLVNVLGAEHSISWESLTSGVVRVQDELKRELHALNRAIPRTVSPIDTPVAAQAPRARKKSAQEGKKAAAPKKRAAAKKKPTVKTK